MNKNKTGRLRTAAARLAQGAGLLTLVFASPVRAQTPSSADSYDGLYASIGVASVKGSANATGSFVESESKYSAAGRVALGYELSLASPFTLRGELYVLPQKVPLGLGDEAKNTWGFAVLPTFAVRQDTKLFVGLGYEQGHTNSPVSSWRSFSVDTPVLAAGVSYSLESLLNVPLALSARYEYAQYQKIDFEGQFDRIKQQRLTFSADYRF